MVGPKEQEGAADTSPVAKEAGRASAFATLAVVDMAEVVVAAAVAVVVEVEDWPLYAQDRLFSQPQYLHRTPARHTRVRALRGA